MQTSRLTPNKLRHDKSIVTYAVEETSSSFQFCFSIKPRISYRCWSKRDSFLSCTTRRGWTGLSSASLCIREAFSFAGSLGRARLCSFISPDIIHGEARAIPPSIRLYRAVHVPRYTQGDTRTRLRSIDTHGRVGESRKARRTYAARIYQTELSGYRSAKERFIGVYTRATYETAHVHFDFGDGSRRISVDVWHASLYTYAYILQKFQKIRKAKKPWNRSFRQFEVN